MNNDNFVPNRDFTKENENLQRQQFMPGRTPTPPPLRRPGSEQIPRTGSPEMTPGVSSQFPGMGRQPRSAPPDFIPEAPRMERQPEGPGAPRGQRPGQERSRYDFYGGPGRPGRQYYDREEFRVRPRDLRRCLNRFTFIWLINGDSFWFFPTFVDDRFVLGFRWRRNRWEFDRINLRRIFFFRCY